MGKDNLGWPTHILLEARARSSLSVIDLLIFLLIISIDLESPVFSMVFNSWLCFIIFGAQASQIWPVTAPSSWFLCPCDILHLFFFFLNHFLTFCHNKMFQTHLVPCPCPAPAPGISHFSEESFFLLVGDGMGNQDLCKSWCYILEEKIAVWSRAVGSVFSLFLLKQ